MVGTHHHDNRNWPRSAWLTDRGEKRLREEYRLVGDDHGRRKAARPLTRDRKSQAAVREGYFNGRNSSAMTS
jgi:hypothetical protein